MKLARCCAIATTIAIAIALVAAPATLAVAAEPDKQAPAEVTPSEARAWVALFDAVVDIVVKNRDDCGKMAGGLHAVIDANQQTIARARDAKAKGKRLPKSIQRHMLDNMRRMVAALDKCGRDDNVTAAFKRIDLGERKR